MAEVQELKPELAPAKTKGNSELKLTEKAALSDEKLIELTTKERAAWKK